MAQIPVIFLAFANERETESRYLRGLAKEQAQIREALEPAQEAGLCEVVVESNATLEVILNTFQKSRYQDRIGIFHFAGHADGYQLLLESLESAQGSNEVAHGDGLVSFLSGQKGLSLIFLNGCSTYQQSKELVEAGVPAVIGTSQAISDDVATRLATRFYANLGQGATLMRAWKEAQDEIQIRLGGQTRSLFWEGEDTDLAASREPWELHVKDGAEVIKDWNLPEAVENPLFGLPLLPSQHLPEQPYRFLERYTRDQAEIFFGRSYYIRDLYDRATSPSSAPVILFYGQSGVGKSSMLDAGVLPRLEQTCRVIYIRRSLTQGLLGTLEAALEQGREQYQANFREEDEATMPVEDVEGRIKEIESLVIGLPPSQRGPLEQLLQQLQSQGSTSPSYRYQPSDLSSFGQSLKKSWQALESDGKPLLILLDQVEEVFTQPRPQDPRELEDFLAGVSNIFGQSGRPPLGKLILGFRKEYHPEIEEVCKKLQIPREGIFLKHLERKDIVEVVQGLSRSERLQRQYRLTVEPTLGEIIADDLLEDKDSPIAPVLQILLTKMWLLTEQDQDRFFSVAKYQHLRREGILMGDFLDQQLEEIKRLHPTIYHSGLPLDVLYAHTTELGTAGSQTRAALLDRYHNQDAQNLDQLLGLFKNLYLLADAGYEATGLAHDTLAPLVQQRFRLSDLPGQRAARILENKVVELENDANTILDETDLIIVESGERGMPAWTDTEIRLIEASRRQREKNLRFRRNLRIAGVIAGLLILAFGIFALISRQNALESATIAETNARRADSTAEVAMAESNRANLKTREAELARADADSQKVVAIAAQKNAELNEALAKLKEAEALANEELARVAKDSALAAKQLAEVRGDSALAAQNRAERDARLAAQAARRALARSLANKARQVEEPALKGSLATQAYLFNDSAQGPSYDPDIYEGLYEALKALQGDGFNLSQFHSSGGVRGLSFDQAGEFLYTVGSDGRVIRRRWAGESQTEQLARIYQPQRALAFSEGGGLAVAQVSLGTTRIPQEDWIGNQQVVLNRLPETLDLVPVPGNDEFIAIGKDGVLRHIRGDEVVVLDTADIEAIAILLDGSLLAGAGRDGKLYLWRLDQEELEPYVIDAKGNTGLSAVAFSSDQRWLAFGDRRGRIYLKDLRDDSDVIIRTGHQEKVSDLAFRPDSKQLASGSRDKSVKLWNLESQNQLPIPLADHPGYVTSMTYTPDGKELIVGLETGAVKRWPSKPGLMQPVLCALLTREITPKEWELYVGEGVPYEARMSCQ